MKKFLLTLCVLLCCMGASRAQVEYPDVPLDHWAYNAINKLGKEDFLEYCFSDTYSGGRAMTRYEFAIAVARILQTAQVLLEVRDVPSRALQRQTELQHEATDAITKLAIEFAPELKALGVGNLLEKFQSTLRAASQPSQVLNPQPKIVAPPFSDIPKNHWAFAAVETLRQSGIVISYPSSSSSGARETFQ